MATICMPCASAVLPQRAVARSSSATAALCAARPALLARTRAVRPSRRGPARVCASAEEPESKSTLGNLDAMLRGAQPPEEAAPEAAPAKPKPTGMSKEQKAKLRAEYIGFGGSEKQAMSSNLYLNLILGISAIAVIAKVTGILPQ